MSAVLDGASGAVRAQIVETRSEQLQEVGMVEAMLRGELAPFVGSGSSSQVLLNGPPTLLAPLSPPMAWDELAYHLPHAREWARSGRLVVTDWLRPAVEEGDPEDFVARVIASLDKLAEHDFQPDGVTARYAVV